MALEVDPKLLTWPSANLFSLDVSFVVVVVVVVVAISWAATAAYGGSQARG